MNLALLQEYLRPYDECRILGRPFSAGFCDGELIALTRRGEAVCLPVSYTHLTLPTILRV